MSSSAWCVQPARRRIQTGPSAFVGANYGEAFLVHVSIEVDRLGIAAGTGKQYHAPSETGKVKGGGNGFGMAGGVNDQCRVLFAALRSQGPP